MERKIKQEKIEAQLKEWAEKIGELKAHADRAKADLKVRYTEEIHKLQKKQETAQGRLREIRESSGEAWKELRTGAGKSTKELKQALGRATSKFKKAA